MGRIGMPELLIILAIVIVIFGANRLPGLGRGIGNAIKNFKDEMKDKDDKDDKDEDKNRDRDRRAS
jgi:sec-independent protein translocase protein TatA